MSPDHSIDDDDRGELAGREDVVAEADLVIDEVLPDALVEAFVVTADEDEALFLGKLIDNKVVPAPDDDTLYMIHFPPTVRVTMYGSSSCQEFCAYHSSFMHGSQVVRYGVMPDQNAGGCQNGCGVSGGQPVGSTSLTAPCTSPNQKKAVS